MKWIEIIHLRVADADREALEHEISALIPKVVRTRGLRNVRAYRSAVADGDWSIHLRWTSGRVEPQGSETCICLMHVLGAFGLLSHSVWVEA
jgi:hypothetical protein